jgi:hypothetical protein
MNRELIQAFEDACFAQYSAELELHEALEEAAGDIASEILQDPEQLIRYADGLMNMAVGDDFLSEALLRYLVTGDAALRSRILKHLHWELVDDEAVQEAARERVLDK